MSYVKIMPPTVEDWTNRSIYLPYTNKHHITFRYFFGELDNGINMCIYHENAICYRVGRSIIILENTKNIYYNHLLDGHRHTNLQIIQPVFLFK